MDCRTRSALQEFDRWSVYYDWDPLQLFFFKPTHSALLNALAPSDLRILDIGCGTGRFAARLMARRPGTRVVGLDLSRSMLCQAKARLASTGVNAHLVQGDSETIPFPDNSFDAITCAHSFHHYPHQQRVLEEMHRVLRPGGQLLIVDGDRDRWWGHFLFQVMVVWMEGAVNHLPSRFFRECFKKAGFHVVGQRRRRGPLPFLLTIGTAVKKLQPPLKLRPAIAMADQ
jgi:ubiquinone/menaquinone biosynthesis C-methylase UbiE